MPGNNQKVHSWSIKPKILSMIGAVALILGCFLPLINAPIVGSISYVLRGNGDGIFVALLAVIGFVLALQDRTVSASITGWLSLGIIGFTFFNLTSKISATRTQMASDLAGNPFRGVAESFSSSIMFGVAWPVLFIGAVMLIAAGFMQSTKQINLSDRFNYSEEKKVEHNKLTPVKRASFWEWFRDGD
jgi:hypothetical protein